MINSYFSKYNIGGVGNILDLRISDLQLTNIKVIPTAFIDRSDNNILEVISQVEMAKEKMVLIPLNVKC